jgi:rRNA small subunit pseudouridine methyltransferase Nep1
MLKIVFAEAALETIPKKLLSHPSVVKWAKGVGKRPERTLLDRSYHHRAMLTLDNGFKRGRPDIIHFSLLGALGTPLNREGLLRTYVHTFGNFLIYLKPDVRLPRNYNRFVGLIEQLFRRNRVPEQGRALLKLRKGHLSDLLDEVNPSYVSAFTRKGESRTLHEVMASLVKLENPLVIVGAFPSGIFSEETVKLADELVSIDQEMLDAWTVTSRIIYEYERLIGLSERRLGKN